MSTQLQTSYTSELIVVKHLLKSLAVFLEYHRRNVLVELIILKSFFLQCFSFVARVHGIRLLGKGKGKGFP